MTREEFIRKSIARTLLEQGDIDPDDELGGGEVTSAFDSEEDWSKPKGRRSNAYIAAENLVSSNPKSLFDRLGFTKVSTPQTGKLEDVRNFLQQVTMSNADLAQVYGKVSMSGDSVFVERRRETRANSGYFGSSAGPSYVVQSAAACGRWINLLMIAASKMGWVKFNPEKDFVLLSSNDTGIIRVTASSYPPEQKQSSGTKAPQSSQNKGNVPKK
jgi:hypothetical protein